MLLGGEQTVPC